MNTPEPHQPYWQFTDASGTAAGACLAQMSADGKQKPIGFGSHRFNPTQARPSTIEKEAFGIIWVLKTFDYWLYGVVMNVVSDRNPLPYLTTSTPQGAKLAKWALSLQRYNVTVRRRKGHVMPMLMHCQDSRIMHGRQPNERKGKDSKKQPCQLRQV